MTVYPSPGAADNLEQRLDQLLEVDRFGPAANFVEDVIAGPSNDSSSLETTDLDRFGPRTCAVVDAARRDADGHIWIIGRIDDVITDSGLRRPAAKIESAPGSHCEVARAAVVGDYDELTGHAIVAFVTVGVGTDAGLEAELHECVAERTGKLARPRKITFARDLPRTRSGQIMRRAAPRIRRPGTRRHRDPRRTFGGRGASGAARCIGLTRTNKN